MVNLPPILSLAEENLLLGWRCFSYFPNRQQAKATYRLICPVQMGTEKRVGKENKKRVNSARINILLTT